MATGRFYRRRFLNLRGHHAGAYVIAEVRLYRRSPSGIARSEVDAGLTIADCNRIASLDFNGYDDASVSNALHKARLLREVVCDFVDALEAAAEEWRHSRESSTS